MFSISFLFAGIIAPILTVTSALFTPQPTFYPFEVEGATCARPVLGGSRVTNTLAVATDAAYADFNNDGRLDFAIQSSSTGTIFTQSGRGDGFFDAPRIIDNNSSGFSVISGDFNNDGHADLLTPAKAFFGDGAGNFSPPRLLQLGSNATAFVPGDFNGDDNLDFAGIVFSTGTVEAFFGDGFGGFGNRTIVGFASQAAGFSVSDVNSDGISDLAAVLNSNTVSIVLGSANGVFQTPVNYPLGGADSVGLIATGDLDGDGDSDIVASSVGFGQATTFMVVLLNNGSGIFSVQPRTTEEVSSISRMVLADVNLDNRLDLVANAGSTVSVRFGNNGTFGIPRSFPGLVSQSRLFIEDFTGDGVRDIASASGAFASFVVFNNDGAGNFGAKLFDIDTDHFHVDTRSGDFNEDRKTDMAYANQGLTVRVAFGDGIGGFGSIVAVPVSRQPRAMLVSDVNNDGNQDLFVLVQNNGDGFSRAGVAFGNGNGTFQPFVEGTTGYALQDSKSLVLADANSDGLPDLFARSSNGVNVLFYRNLGNGAFFQTVGINLGTTIGAITAGDFNLDGRADLAVLSGGVHIYFGLGALNFDFAGFYPAAGAHHHIFTSDFNNDGNLDIAATNEQIPPTPGLGKVAILMGVGKGGFGPASEFTVGRGPSNMEAADFDGDGNRDLAVINAGHFNGIDSRITIFYSDGTGSFPRVNYYVTGQSPRGLITGDFDSNGKPDLAAANFFWGNSTILLNSCAAPPATNLPQLQSAADISVQEGDASDTNVNATISLSSPSTTPVRVRYFTAPFAGISGLSENELVEAFGRRDYRVTSGELLFMPGQTSKNVQLTVRGDTIDEFDEKFSLFIANASNASIGDNQTIITILDNDAPPALSIAAASAPEGNSGNAPITFTASLTAISEKPVSAQFVTGGGTATVNQDYTRAQGTLIIPVGQISGNIIVNAIGDLTVEPNETFLLDLTDPTNATLGNGRATGTIINDDIGGTIQFTSATYSVTEGTAGIQIGISRASGIGGGVSVRFRTQAGTATPSQDYTEVVSTVNFGDNETSKNVFVPIISDQLDELDETVNLILDNPVNAALGLPSTAVLTIQDAENQPDLSALSGSVIEGDNGSTFIQLSMRLSRPTQRSVSVDFATVAGTATPGVDYTEVSGRITLPPGVTRKFLNISVNGDFLYELDETLTVNFSNPANANLLTNQVTGRIINDEVNAASRTEIVSVNQNNNGTGSSDSLDPVISADGQLIAFESFASNLAGADTNFLKDIYVRNISTKQTRLVSANISGTNSGNCNSLRPYISANGRFVAFTSCSSDLTPQGAHQNASVFVRDLQTNQTRMVSINLTGGAGSGDAVGISADGRYVVFQSRDQNLTSVPDTQNFMDLFVRDMQTNTTQLITVSAAGGAAGNADSGNTSPVQRYIQLTPDGRFVLYPSAATNLVSAASGGTSNLFVRDLQSQTTTAVSINAAGTQLVGAEPSASISDDGRYVAFSSISSAFGPTDTNNLFDVYRRDTQANLTSLISVNAAGTNSGTGNSSAPVLSANGRYVAFHSDAANLTALPDANNLRDVFRRDTNAGATFLVSLNTGGTGAGQNESLNSRISADGETVLFVSSANDLVPPPTDNNFMQDLYMRNMLDGTTVLASTNAGGTAVGNQGTNIGVLSTNGSVVAFATASSNLIPNDTNGFTPDIFAFTRYIQPMPIVDFDDDNKSDLSVFRPSTNFWFVSNSSDGTMRAQQFGSAGDIPVADDYDGDGKTDLAVFRRGTWYALRSRDNSLLALSFGQAGDIPLHGDFDGDRIADLAYFRQGVWNIRESSDGNVRTQQFGLGTDVPAVADFDGDKRSDIAVFRNGVWYIFTSANFGLRVDIFGSAGDRPVQGDFDGDGKADVAVYRPSNGGWYILRSSNGSVFATQFGISTDAPLRADFDGDAKADIAVFRNGVWYVIQSTNQALRVENFGTQNDVAIPALP